MAEKTAFLDLLLEMAKTKYSEQFAESEMTEDEKKQLYAFDYSSLSALRDIKRVFNNRLMDYFTEKRCFAIISIDDHIRFNVSCY